LPAGGHWATMAATCPPARAPSPWGGDHETRQADYNGDCLVGCGRRIEHGQRRRTAAQSEGDRHQAARSDPVEAQLRRHQRDRRSLRRPGQARSVCADVQMAPRQHEPAALAPNDRMITVLKGTWWVGTGDKFEPDTTVPLPTGSYVTHFAKEVHYDGAKDAE